jgi:tetratricopeptide (TPR) repeat protein
MPHRPADRSKISRRDLIAGLGITALGLRAAPFLGQSLRLRDLTIRTSWDPADLASATRYRPHYPTQSALSDMLALVTPGSDSYLTEQYASEISEIFRQWSQDLRLHPGSHGSLTGFLAETLPASPLSPVKQVIKRDRAGIQVFQRSFGPPVGTTPAAFARDLAKWLGLLNAIHLAEFEIFGIDIVSDRPVRAELDVRYTLATIRENLHREERVGTWRLACSRDIQQRWTIHGWEARGETLSVGEASSFVDVTTAALGSNDSYSKQLLHGVDYWRTVLDGASGIDIYANNGIAAGDFDNDGLDDIYVCQPAGLPNRLYKNRGDGTFEDVSAHAGVDVLDNTACALFADFDNRGLQDLLVVCGSGPLLFRNNGDGTFTLKSDAFQFAQPPNGTFTHAALADYDNDGHLDIYFCTYQYYLGLDQYHYPVPYYDARNGPQNCLLHNEGGGRFVETTQGAGLNVENNRYSFASAWGDANGNGSPDLCVANDFGKSQLYRNNGDGTFRIVSQESHVEDAAAGMSACWADFSNSGRQDIYISSMWEAPGQRVSQQKQFHADANAETRRAYRTQSLGNALYRNAGDGTFRNVGAESGTAMGRWSWAADSWDFDHDGLADLYVTNGYISTDDRTDIDSFFWRQIVANSPEDASPRLAYEHGWGAINELVRADKSWNAYERNVLFANNGDGTFAEVSFVAGLDCIEDSRSFALADIDQDGRQELLLKNRNAPQMRILHNSLKEIGHSVCFRLRGHKSNRDAIGSSVTLEAGSLKQTKYLQAGTGFLCQHSKELFFGVGNFEGPLKATVRWPSGLTQTFDTVPVDHRVELEEGVKTFFASAFKETSTHYKTPSPPPAAEVLPAQVETWLTTPLKAPAFTLSDSAGKEHQLRQWLGGYVLLTFWTTASIESVEQLRHLQKTSAPFLSSLSVVALNLDEPAQADFVRSFVTRERFSFTVLLGTPALGGIYNIVYRYLFDRRRDLFFPSSLLIDKSGFIVKVYQSAIAPERILEDLKSVPITSQERIQRALPFKGNLHRSTLQRNDFTYGMAFFQHGFYEQAQESFQQVVTARPNDPEAYYNLGTLNLRLNHFDKAKEYLQETLKLRPDYAEAWNNLGMMAAQQGQAEDAINNFKQALQLRPDYEIALVNLGNIYRRARAYPQAEDALKRALSLQSDDAEVHYSLGMLYAQQSQLESAADFLQQAIALRSTYPEALNNLGIVYVRLQQFDKAEQQFKTGMQVAPDNDQAYLNLARLYALQGNRVRAREVVQGLLQRRPDNESAQKALQQLQ